MWSAVWITVGYCPILNFPYRIAAAPAAEEAAPAPVAVPAAVLPDPGGGAEIHQYGVQGNTKSPTVIPDVDFAGIARALGAQGATIRNLQDLVSLRHWVAAGARGVFLADCRISTSVRAPYMAEIVAAAARRGLLISQSPCPKICVSP